MRDVLTVFLGLISPVDRVHHDAMGTLPGHRVPGASTRSHRTAPDPEATHVVDDEATPWI
ncbi:MAG: hypothetical protein JNJ98_19105 [Gemmatimonadetes bacterium]|nr:hypothetical protein [Gemmatimonadota bacterium]